MTEEDGATEATAAGHPGQRPDIWRLCSLRGATPTRQPKHQWPDIRPVRPDIRRLGNPRTFGIIPGNLAVAYPESNQTATSARTSGPCLGHPASRERPDIWPPARTSGACLLAATGQRPMYLSFPLTPSWLRLYILLPLLLVRVGKVIAHLIESFAPCTTLLLRERETTTPYGGQDLHLGEDPAGYIIKTPSWVAPFKTSSWR